MRILLFCIALTLFNVCRGQEKKDSCDCAKVIDELSYYWKLDSLANNGFRFYTYDRFMKCRLEKVYRALLLDKLGHPNEIRKTNKGIEYIYYYYDGKSMPKNFDGPPACWYISFAFGEYDKYANNLTKGDIDR